MVPWPHSAMVTVVVAPTRAEGLDCMLPHPHASPQEPMKLQQLVRGGPAPTATSNCQGFGHGFLLLPWLGLGHSVLHLGDTVP